MTVWDEDRRELAATESQRAILLAIRHAAAGFFTPESGFGPVCRINYLDGVRVSFATGDVAHIRPSGNADELRIYAVADTPSRANAIAAVGVAEPDGVLRRLEKAVKPKAAAAPPARLGEAYVETPSREAVLARIQAQPTLVALRGTVQHYDWGGFDFIPSLLGATNESRRPFAELWIGSHAKSPATAEVDAVSLPLTQLMESAAPIILGPANAVRFQGRLPFLFKVLDARTMLSIQAHPTLEQANEGFERETRAGIPLRAPERNYQDRNHKPEVHVALTDFWMLHGFRPLDEIAAILGDVPEFRAIMPDFAARLAGTEGRDDRRQALLRELYRTVMHLSQAAVDGILNPLIQRLLRSRCQDKNQPDYWVLRAAETFALPEGHCDRGIFSIYLLNLIRLEPGQGTYQSAGTLHAYLEGINVELMANSDNVLRGGLTSKHVDVAELMNILTFASGRPGLLSGEALSATETVYRTTAEEFELSRLRVWAGQPHASGSAPGPHILLTLEGEATVRADQQCLGLKRGQIVLVPHGCSYRVEAANHSAVLYKAGIP